MPGCSLSSLCRSLSVHRRNVPHPVSEIDGTTIVDNGSELWRLVSRRWEGCIVKKRFLKHVQDAWNDKSGSCGRERHNSIRQARRYKQRAFRCCGCSTILQSGLGTRCETLIGSEGEHGLHSQARS
ncbi:hypothetical protein ARMGADRAFT_479488 [Armillaria gallica]|uniref:Uncharacterized protein n=1 Tax=Armillaria gallica TaxID=47427 RepID=A0A2H3DEQ5_ARMGA|nr:hypothetical protein ARMGADRAFT_479488 [Armillaria gallica]